MHIFFLTKKVNYMQTRRNNALAALKRLAENLTNSEIVLSDKEWAEELGETCIWVDNDGTKSSLPEINKRIEDIKSKAREQLFFTLYACNSFGLFIFL